MKREAIAGISGAGMLAAIAAGLAIQTGGQHTTQHVAIESAANQAIARCESAAARSIDVLGTEAPFGVEDGAGDTVEVRQAVLRVSAECVEVTEPPDTIEPPDTTPQQPFELSATAAPGAITLSWSGTIADDVTQIAPVRSLTGAGYDNLMRGGLPRTATSYTDTTVAAGETYHYLLRFRHGLPGDQSFSISESVSATAAPDSTPSEPPDTTSEPPDTTGGQAGEPPPDVDRPAPVPGWPLNEPNGMTPLAFVDGASKVWHAPWRHYGQNWPTDRVVVVNDPDSKYGRAVEKRFRVGDGSVWASGLQIFPHQLYDQVYVRLVFKFSPNWQYHSAGEKLWLANASGVTGTSMFVWGGTFYVGAQFVGPPITARQWFPVPADAPPQTSGAAPIVGGPYVRAVRGQYHTVELVKRMNDPGVPNGSLRLWIDGVEYTRFVGRGASPEYQDIPLTGLIWAKVGGPSDSGITTRMELPLFWGGQGDVKDRNDWIRVSEVYISARN